MLSHRCVHPVVQGHFSVSSAGGHFVQQLALSSDLCWATVQVIGCLLPVIRNSFWMCQLKETHDVCMCWKQLCSTSLMLTSLAAPFLLSGACVSVVFGGNRLFCLNFIWESTLNSQNFWYLGTCVFYRDLVDCYRWWKCVITVLHRCGSGSELSRERMLKPPDVSSNGSKAGHHMEKHGFVEDHLSLGCSAKHLPFHPLISMIEKSEILPPPQSFQSQVASLEVKNLAYW